MHIKQKITVKFDYNIHFTRGIFDLENPILKDVLGVRQSKIMIFLDSNVAAAWPGIEHRIGEWFDASGFGTIRSQ